MLKHRVLRLGSLLAVFLSVACAHSGRVWLSGGDQGAMACKRECLGQHQACASGVRYGMINGQLVGARNRDCGPVWDQCMATCPMTCAQEKDGGCTTPEGVRLVPPGE